MGGNNIKKILFISFVLYLALIGCVKINSPAEGEDQIINPTLTPRIVMPLYIIGGSDKQFNYPRGVAADSTGNIYVTDSGNCRIQKFTSAGVFLTKWGSEGNADGQFSSPDGVAIDSADNVYIADRLNHGTEYKNSHQQEYL